MGRRIQRNQIMAKLNECAKIIREAGEIDMASLALMIEYSVSWIQMYKPAILKMFPDIIYENGRFKSLALEPPHPQDSG